MAPFLLNLCKETTSPEGLPKHRFMIPGPPDQVEAKFDVFGPGQCWPLNVATVGHLGSRKNRRKGVEGHRRRPTVKEGSSKPKAHVFAYDFRDRVLQGSVFPRHER